MTQRAEPSLENAGHWLEQLEGESPVLLIAPHGGKVPPDRRNVFNPKINDLHTADITRELARRIGAPAIINAAMDRNRLDLNRLSQVLTQAPWFLELVTGQIRRIVEHHGKAVVLLIHGWNVVQPSVDIGIGARRHGAELRPSGSARVSASEGFINGPLARLARQLGAHGIAASFGLRYPGGGAQNLLQAFTDRHAASDVPGLSALSAMAARGEIEAVQLELSMALRMPGSHRERCVEAMAGVFGSLHDVAPDTDQPRLQIIRRATSHTTVRAPKRAPAPAPPRIGIECFDPQSRVGVVASFDVSARGPGARMLILLPNGRVAVSTNEGATRIEGSKARQGPLQFEASRDRIGLTFRGAVVMVREADSYLRTEQALASGWLDEAAEVELAIEPYPDGVNLEAMFDQSGGEGVAVFGRFEGRVRVDGIRCELSGFGRSGSASPVLGAHPFLSRRMIWACFGDEAMTRALEIRRYADDGTDERSDARALNHDRWNACEATRIEIDTPSISGPPAMLNAVLTESASREHTLVGEVKSFVLLARPGPANTRIVTSLGFASFRLGQHRGVGLFECLRRSAIGADSESGENGETDDG